MRSTVAARITRYLETTAAVNVKPTARQIESALYEFLKGFTLGNQVMANGEFEEDGDYIVNVFAKNVTEANKDDPIASFTIDVTAKPVKSASGTKKVGRGIIKR